ncbi:AraC-type DNA-binding protein [Pelosinus propionicus DSM 13327]|uniref:AraC-type DNA-binding protein n=1 Tax=Pelosinus propionicus DSM 13327 TaxID=1123291 RepID=A0A1I4IG53_9FIRM|nr:AraC-type DNA-binding protein [Pelosinus propionicus DSM 13327]
MQAMSGFDFDFGLNANPHQFIHQHTTSSKNTWDKFHSHPGMEFIYVLQGEGSAIVDQNIYPFKPGSLMYFQPFQLHRVKAYIPEKTFYIRSKLLLEPSIIDCYLQKFTDLHRFFQHLWHSNLSCQVIQSTNSYQFETLFTLYGSRQKQLELTEDFALFFLLFITTVKDQWNVQNQMERKTQLRHIHYAEYVMRWIDANYHEEFTLESLVKELHLSRYHISHLFRKATGSSITEYLTYRRLREASLLLRTTSLPLQEISNKIGFNNVSYFCQLFKKNVGVTPSQYRIKQ